MASDATLEDEIVCALSSAVTGLNAERNRRIFMAHSGLDGTGGCSLQAAGRPYGITRECARQVSKRVRQALAQRPQRLASLTATAQALCELAPARCRDVETRLREAGLVRGAFNVRGLLSAVAIFHGEPLDLEVDETAGEPILVRSRQRPLVDRVLHHALDEVTRNGAASVEHLAESVSAEGCDAALDLVRCVLESCPTTRWLDERRWFYFGPDSKNRLLAHLDKVFYAYEEVGLRELRLAIIRAWRRSAEHKWVLLPEHMIEKVKTKKERSAPQGKRKVRARRVKGSSKKTRLSSTLLAKLQPETTEEKAEADLAAGWKTARRVRVPVRLMPVRVMRALLADTGEYDVEHVGGRCVRVRRRRPVGGPDGISEMEFRLARYLAQSGPETVREKTLEDALVGEDGDKYAFAMALNFSPLVYRPRRGQYGAIGRLAEARA